MTVATPTLLSSRQYPGHILSTALGNLAWSDDGQILYVYSQGIRILVCCVSFSHSPRAPAHNQTPYLLSSLPAPPIRIESITGPQGSRKADDNDSTSRGNARRPPGGEVAWYENGVSQVSAAAEERYQWTEVGGESWRTGEQ
jgi:hypothetical protein